MKQTRLFNLLKIIAFLLLSLHCRASDWNNYVINYPKNVYGKGSQTWQIASFDDHFVYYANKNGMVQFDGNSWNLFPLHNGSDVRSVFPSVLQSKIYVGGINEFGYFEPGEDGKLLYTCLSDSLPVADRAVIGNIWGIHENDNILYFQGDAKVWKLLNGKYTSLQMDCKIDCSDMVNGVLYVGTDQGVWALVGNTFFPLQGGELLSDKRIRSILPYKDGMLIVTAYDGLYHYNGRRVTPFTTGAEDFLRNNEVFCAASSLDCIALGTVHKGILLFDIRTMNKKYFNEYNGLQNNTVLSLSFDGRGNIWAGLDSGIDYICLRSSLTNLYNYPYSYGTGYAALLNGDHLYLGTNRGLYYIRYPLHLSDQLLDIRPIPQSSGQVWNLCRIGNEIFCLHDRGIYLIEGETMRKIPGLSGAWLCQPVMGTSDKMYVGVYDGLYLLEKKGKDWKIVTKIAGLFDSCRFFEQENARVLWISGVDKTTRLELNDDYTKVVNLRSFGTEDGFPLKRDIYVSKIKGKIYFTTPQGIYRFNPATKRMESCSEIATILKGASAYTRLIEYNEHLIALCRREICIAGLNAYKKGAGTSVIPIDFPMIELVQGAETIVPISDSLMIIPNDNGFALFRVPASNHVRDNRLMHIRNVYLSYPKDSLLYTGNFLSRKPKPKIAYQQNAIRFEFGLSLFVQGEEVTYQYRLNQNPWSERTRMHAKEYSNFAEGDYFFEVRAHFPDGTISSDTFNFTILPPWYRTPWAYTSYVFLFVLAFWYLYKWDDMRVKRKKQQAVVEKDKELQEMEKEYEEENARKERQIVELEKEKLEYELKHKSQEMANLMINFVRKNEMLTEIKSDLFKVITEFKGDRSKEYKQMLLVVSNKIDSNIQSDDVLKRIEEQFDLIHNNFMKRLGEKHPDLSLNERMMCAYLKMNLSSKEIAPLLNISLRGVETMRYRLRKKFELEREDSLTDYLHNVI